MTIQAVAGGLSGGLGSVIAGGNFWRGAKQGAIVAVYNHAVHSIANGSKTETDVEEPWDTNGDGKLQKKEADEWWKNGNGEDISVDNSKIDWSGLELPEKINNKENIFAIDTVDAFTILPLETAATYGGTRFQKTGKNTAKVLNQEYHYDMKPYNTLSTSVRNIMTKVGRPFGVGKKYWINYRNPTLRFSKHVFYEPIIVPGLMYHIPKKKEVRYFFRK